MAVAVARSEDGMRKTRPCREGQACPGAPAGGRQIWWTAGVRGCERLGGHLGVDRRSSGDRDRPVRDLGVTARACATAPVLWLVADSDTASGSDTSSSPTLQPSAALQPSTAQMTSSSSSFMVFGWLDHGPDTETEG